jgi:hypothetical protein
MSLSELSFGSSKILGSFGFIAFISSKKNNMASDHLGKTFSVHVESVAP